MLKDILVKSNERLPFLTCCKNDGSECNCFLSLDKDYWQQPDSYNCEKKMTTYVLKFGPAYVSEIYHYFVASDLKNEIPLSRELNVISLGCGFSPDYIALKKYFYDNSINKQINYLGLGNSRSWDFLRPKTNECRYNYADLTKPFRLDNADVIILCKVFSTLYRNNLSSSFLDQLRNAVNTSLKQDAIIVFIDVNHRKMGRDIFHYNVKRYMPNFVQYYFDGYNEPGWIQIPQRNLIVCVPYFMSEIARKSTGQTVVFEYRK